MGGLLRRTTDIIDEIDQSGFCILPGFINSSQLAMLEEAHRALTNHSNIQTKGISRQQGSSKGTVVRVSKSALKHEQPEAYDFFNQELMNQVAKAFFDKHPFDLNDEVFFTDETGQGQSLLPWHFDREHSLKFYLPLTQLSDGGGALEFDKGSQREGHFRANFYKLKGIPTRNIPNDIPESEIRIPVQVKLNPGDLIIFDSDCFHRVCVLENGHPRKIIRGHTHSLPRNSYKVSLFSSSWWLSSFFNLAKLIGNQAARKIASERLTKAICREDNHN